MERKYKDSGVNGFGHIPYNWKTMALKYTALGKSCLFLDGDWIESPYITDSGIRYLTTGNISPLNYKEQGKSYISEQSFKELNCSEVFPGDILIARLNEPIARACIVPDLGNRIVTAVDNVIYRPNNSLFYKRYMLYLLNSSPFTENANLLARGSTMHRISRSMLGNMKVIVPPLPEQQRIADYLDKKCSEIDELIALQEQMIAQLTDYKQSVISEAVTKGLNPNVQLVPSGIDWIGDVPKGWKITRLKYYGTIKSGESITIEEIKDEGTYPVWGGNGLMGYTEKYNESSTSIVIGRVGALCGNVRLLNSPTFVSDNALIFKLFKEVDAKYMLWLLKGANLNRLNTSNAQPLITGTKVKNVSFAIPPLSEQRTIATYLDSKCSEIDSLISLKQQKIEELKEYKKSIIYEYVTGKKEVI